MVKQPHFMNLYVANELTMDTLQKRNITSTLDSHPNANLKIPIIPTTSLTQGITSLLLLIMIIGIIVTYCLWGAPWCKAFFWKRICFCCTIDDEIIATDIDSTDSLETTNSPTLILLSQGQLLLIENNRRRNSMARLPYQKRLSLKDYFPPPYESIFGQYFDNSTDLPPSYSELSIQEDLSNKQNFPTNDPTCSHFLSSSTSTSSSDNLSENCITSLHSN